MEAGTPDWPSVAVVGAGAVGSYFGAMLARAGAPVTLIGRQAHVDAVAREGVILEGVRVNERIAATASTEISAAQESQVVLICVKTVDTQAVARALRPHLQRGSTVLSLQNGVDNVERMYSAAQIEAIPAVVYVAAAMAGPGHVRHSGRGDLVIGHVAATGEPTQEAAPALHALARMFERAEIPCRVSADIRGELWTKMTLNCAYNAICALGRARYGRMLRCAETRNLMERVIAEVVVVARAQGVSLSEADLVNATWRLGEAMPAALSSTAQDIQRGKPTEIDALNGYVVRRGRELGIESPGNQALFALVKLLEQSATGE